MWQQTTLHPPQNHNFGFGAQMVLRGAQMGTKFRGAQMEQNSVALKWESAQMGTPL